MAKANTPSKSGGLKKSAPKAAKTAAKTGGAAKAKTPPKQGKTKTAELKSSSRGGESKLKSVKVVMKKETTKKDAAKAKKTVPAVKKEAAPKKTAPKKEAALKSKAVSKEAAAPKKTASPKPAVKAAEPPKKAAEVSKKPAPLPVKDKKPASLHSGKADPVPAPKKKPARTRYNDKELEHFRKIINAKREELLVNIQTLRERITDPQTGEYINENSPYSLHMAEQGTDAMEREKMFLFNQRDAKFLSYLEDALKRIELKTYGLCVECIDDPQGLCPTCPLIPKERLEAVPHSQHCLPIKQRQEKR